MLDTNLCQNCFYDTVRMYMFEHVLYVLYALLLLLILMFMLFIAFVHE